jgi:hypothetical protein
MLPSLARHRSPFSSLALAVLLLALPLPAPAQGGARPGNKGTAMPLFEPAFIGGVGPRVAEAGDGRIPGFSCSAPFEDLKLK